MQKFAWLIVTFVLAVSLTVGCTGGDKKEEKDKGGEKNKTDKEMIEGTWVVEDLEMGGKTFPDLAKKSEMKIVFAGGKTTMKKKGQEEDEEATFVLDSSKTPKTIDVTETKGKDKDKTKKGIYTFDGPDKLKLAITDEGDRPTEFKTKKDSKFGVLFLKREKAK